MSDPGVRSVLSAEGLVKTFRKGGQDIKVLGGVDFSLNHGQIVGILGASGAGKSTFLHIAGGLDSPTTGRVSVAGEDIFKLSEQGLSSFRNRNIGFIFQMHYLLTEFTCMENVMMPGIIAGFDRVEVAERAGYILERVGLSSRLSHRPGELSGGEQQRAAVARALVNEPDIVLADEPTGNLDSVTARSVQDLFLELNEELGTTFLVVTHNREMASKFHARYVLRDGLLDPEE